MNSIQIPRVMVPMYPSLRPLGRKVVSKGPPQRFTAIQTTNNPLRNSAAIVRIQ